MGPVCPGWRPVWVFAGRSASPAHSEASAALSLLPVASVVGVAGAGSAVAGAAVALPVALSATGAVLSVKAVEGSAIGTVYLLERASDGAQVECGGGRARCGGIRPRRGHGGDLQCHRHRGDSVGGGRGDWPLCPMPWAVPAAQRTPVNMRTSPDHVEKPVFHACALRAPLCPVQGPGPASLAGGRPWWCRGCAVRLRPRPMRAAPCESRKPVSPRWWSVAWRWRADLAGAGRRARAAARKVVADRPAPGRPGQVRPALFAPGLGLQNARRPVARDAQAQRLRHGLGHVPAGPGRVFWTTCGVLKPWWPCPAPPCRRSCGRCCRTTPRQALHAALQHGQLRVGGTKYQQSTSGR